MLCLCISAALASSFLHARDTDSFQDTHDTKSFHLAGVNDFDQKRMAATVKIAGKNYNLKGLLGNGGMFCVPTSATDWMAFMGQRGVPGLSITSGNLDVSYTNGLGGYHTYEDVTNAIADMGNLMHTTATGGTNGSNMFLGAVLYLMGHRQPFVMVSTVQGDEYDKPYLYDCIEAVLNGSLVETCGGWYHKYTVGGRTVLVRKGGHACALAEATWNRSDPTKLPFALCNPDNGDSDETVQSPFAYTKYTGKVSDGVFGSLDTSGNVNPSSLKTMGFTYLDKDKNWILDGGLIFSPQIAIAIYGSKIHLKAATKLFDNAKDVTGSYNSGDSGEVVSASRSHISGDVFYVTKKSPNQLFVLHPGSGESTVLQTKLTNIREIQFSSGFDPYVVSGPATVSMIDPRTGDVKLSTTLDYRAGQLVFAPKGNWLAVLDLPHNRYAKLDQNLKLIGYVPVGSKPKGEGALSAEFDASDHLLLFRPGDAHLYDIPPTGGPGTTRNLPASVSKAQSFFSIDDANNLFFSTPNAVLAFSESLSPLQHPFTALPPGMRMHITRNTSNFDPAIHADPSWLDAGPRR